MGGKIAEKGEHEVPLFFGEGVGENEAVGINMLVVGKREWGEVEAGHVVAPERVRKRGALEQLRGDDEDVHSGRCQGLTSYGGLQKKEKCGRRVLD